MFFFFCLNLVETILCFLYLWILVFHHYQSIHSYLLFKYQISFIFSNLSNSLIRYTLEYHTLFFTLLVLLHNFLSLPLCTEFWIISSDLSIHYSFLQLYLFNSSINFFLYQCLWVIFFNFSCLIFIYLWEFFYLLFSYLFFVWFLIFYFQNENLITFYCFLFNYFYYLFYTLLSEVLEEY